LLWFFVERPRSPDLLQSPVLLFEGSTCHNLSHKWNLSTTHSGNTRPRISRGQNKRIRPRSFGLIDFHMAIDMCKCHAVRQDVGLIIAYLGLGMS
jgi:hypothetical protein